MNLGIGLEPPIVSVAIFRAAWDLSLTLARSWSPYLDSLHRLSHSTDSSMRGATQGVIRPDGALPKSWRSPA